MKILIYLFLLTLAFSFSCTQSKSSPSKSQNQNNLTPFFQAFEDSLKEKIESEKLPGLAMIVVKDSVIIYQKVLGLREKGTLDSLDENSVFRIASLSKGFSAVLAGIMVEDSVFNWDDKIVDHYPQFALKDSAQTQRITLRHLLSHTTGLPRHAYTNLVEDGLTLNKIIPRLAGLDLIGAEGRYYAYQNAAFAIIEKIIESKTAASFKSMLKTRIFDPAQMINASTEYADLIKNNNFALPHSYSYSSGDYVPLKQTQKYYNAVSAGGINVSISDMGKWLQVLLGNQPQIISSATLDTIFTPLIKVNTRRYSRRWGVRRSYYAMGWRVLTYNNRPLVFHGGYVNGYRSELVLDRTQGLGVCILSNSPHWYASRIIPEFFAAYLNADSSRYSTLDKN